MGHARASAAASLVALLACGCHPAGTSTVMIALQPLAPIAGVLGFHFTVTNQGQSATADYGLAGPTVLLPSSPVTLALVFPKDRSGSVSVVAEARNATGQVLATNGGTGVVVQGQLSLIVIPLGSPGPGDLATDSAPPDQSTAPDLTSADADTAEMAVPDLLAPDLLAPDLLAADLLTPDLLTPDLAMPDLARPPDLAQPDAGAD